MTRRVRLDAELVRRDLARSREHASTLIDAGHVLVGGRVAAKPATQVGTDQAIVVRSTDEPTWASRGAHKLLGALAAFEPLGLVVEGRRCLDAGASTGGFTDVLLRHGAAEVCAVDVGYGQLVWSLQSDERVHVYDRTNVRTLQPDDIGGPVELVVADLSFISLTVVMPALTRACVQEGDIVLMIKPQFEVGKQNLGKNGVVRDPNLHAEAVHRVGLAAHEHGWATRALAPSPSGAGAGRDRAGRANPPASGRCVVHAGDGRGLSRLRVRAARARPVRPRPLRDLLVARGRRIDRDREHEDVGRRCSTAAILGWADSTQPRRVPAGPRDRLPLDRELASGDGPVSLASHRSPAVNDIVRRHDHHFHRHPDVQPASCFRSCSRRWATWSPAGWS